MMVVQIIFGIFVPRMDMFTTIVDWFQRTYLHVALRYSMFFLSGRRDPRRRGGIIEAVGWAAARGLGGPPPDASEQQKWKELVIGGWGERLGVRG